MTLIIVIPTAAGLVVAADSRLTLANQVCDNVFKIAEVEGIDHTAAFVTGYSTVWKLAGIPANKVCEHVAQNEPQFDAKNLLLNAARRPQASLSTIAQEVADGTGKYIANHPDDYASRTGMFLFQGALAKFDPATSRASTESFSIHLNSDGSVTANKLKIEEFFPTDECRLSLFGEASYLSQAVLAGPGMQFLSERYGRFRQTMSTTERADPTLAADFAVDLIEAASKTSAFIPAATGIGGSVDVLLVGQEPRPLRLHWKNP